MFLAVITFPVFCARQRIGIGVDGVFNCLKALFYLLQPFVGHLLPDGAKRFKFIVYKMVYGYHIFPCNRFA